MTKDQHDHLWHAAVDEHGKRLPAPGRWECDCGVDVPGCAVCGSMLDGRHAVTCGRCVQRTTYCLNDIVRLYAELPDAIKTITGIDYDPTSAGSAHDVTLPGGDALAILAGGTMSAVRADRYGNRHPEDQRESDPPSASAVVSEIEDSWRQARGDAAAPYAQSVRMAVGYLRDHNAWAAEHYDGYAADVAALTWLRGRMSAAAGRDDVPERERTPCVFCGGDVVRFWQERTSRQLGGLSEVRKCTGCDMAWGDAAALAFVNQEHLRAMPVTHPEALVTERQATRIFHELSSGTIRTWLARDRARRERYEELLASWPRRRDAALERRREAEEAGDMKRAAKVKIPPEPEVYERRLPERGKDVLGQTVYRLADITALARPAAPQAKEQAS